MAALHGGGGDRERRHPEPLLCHLVGRNDMSYRDGGPWGTHSGWAIVLDESAALAQHNIDVTNITE